MKPLLLTATVVVLFTPVHAQTPASQIEGWKQDLAQLAQEVTARHPSPFTQVTQEDWESAVQAVESGLTGMTRERFVVELQRLVAMLGDAHSSINPQFDPAQSKARYPLELYLFEDGLHVRKAAPHLGHLVGGKLIRIGEADPGKAVAAVASTISYENLWWIRAMAPERLVIPEVLAGLGLAPGTDKLDIVVEIDGANVQATIHPVEVPAGAGHGHGSALDQAGWVDMRESEEVPLYLRNPHDVMWYEWLDESRTLYVCYRAVASMDGDRPNADFWNEVFAIVDHRNPQRMVIDIRQNSGGNGMLNRPLIQHIVRRPDLDRSDRLFVITGRLTFSAAQQLANQLDWWTQATFVGEPTGQKVSQYGDAEMFTLSNTGVSGRISTIFHQAPNPIDTRDAITPDMYAPVTSDDYRAGIDPALKQILESEGRTPVMDRIAGYLQAGQYEEAKRLLASAGMDPVNRYRTFERDMNAIGYDLLGRGQTEAAIAVFRINTEVYPASANTYDSLGEALLTVGRHAEALEAYRYALEIDPGFPSALQAVQRLEGGGRH